MDELTGAGPRQWTGLILKCQEGPGLDAPVWVAIAVASALLLAWFVRHLLRSCRPAKRSALFSAGLVAGFIGLCMVALEFHVLDTGVMPMRRMSDVHACGSPRAYWALLGALHVANLGLVAMAASAWLRLRRPYVRYSDPVQ